MNANPASRGFTLIELMIVVAIIAILAALAIPAYQDYLIRAQTSEGMVLLDGTRTLLWEFVSTKGHMPPNNFSAGLPTSTSISGKYVLSVDVSGGIGQAKFGNSANTHIANQIIQLSPTTTNGSIKWICKSATINPKYLPSNCR